MKTDWVESLNKARSIPDINVYHVLSDIIDIKVWAYTGVLIQSAVYEEAIMNVDQILTEELSGGN